MEKVAASSLVTPHHRTLPRGEGHPLLFIFIDGVGIGRPDPEINPLARGGCPILAYFDGGSPQADTARQKAASPACSFPPVRLIRTDACLGVAGRPQSATGQTSLFTGVNAPARLGRHLSGFPTRALHELLERSLFRRAADAGLSVSFANAFRPEFFSAAPAPVSATTSCFLQAKIPLRTFDDLRQGAALSHEFTREFIRSQGYRFEPIDAREAATHLVGIFRTCDLLLYEIFLTDVIAHTRSMGDAVSFLEHIERFLENVLEQLDLASESLLICSDHGNIEDLSSRSHTFNPVPTLVWGPAARHYPEERLALTDVAPRLLRALQADA